MVLWNNFPMIFPPKTTWNPWIWRGAAPWSLGGLASKRWVRVARWQTRWRPGKDAVGFSRWRSRQKQLVIWMPIINYIVLNLWIYNSWLLEGYLLFVVQVLLVRTASWPVKSRFSITLAGPTPIFMGCIDSYSLQLSPHVGILIPCLWQLESRLESPLW